MKKIITVVCMAVFMLAVSHVAVAAEFGTPAEAEAMVKKAIAEIKAAGKGWQDYKFTNPASKKIENKTAYIEKVDNLIVGCGVYKK